MDAKSFALGYNAGASKSGGNVSQAELEAAIKKVVPEWALEKTPPKDAVTSVNGKVGAVNLPIPSEAADVKADPAGTAESKTAALRDEVNGKLEDYDKSTAVNNKISSHNVSTESHADLRLELQRIADRLDAALNSDDTSLDDLKEIVAYIKSNKTLIDGVTASKVNVTDIVNNLTTNTANVPLSAAQGVALKLLIESLEEIVEGKVTAEQVDKQISTALSDYLTTTTGDQRYAAKQATETALAEHGGKIAELEEALANSMVEYAESVEWLEANGDKERTYYLPDGYEYKYSNKYVEIPFNANDGTGYLNNIPPNAPWGEPYNPDWHVAGWWTSPLVRIDPTKMAAVGNAAESRVTVSGVPKVVPGYNSKPIVVWWYGSNGSQLLMKGGADLASFGTNSEKATPFTIQLKDGNTFNDSNWASVYGVRIGLGISTSDITKEDVKDLVVNIPFFDFAGYREGWYSTGKLHSNDPAVQENANNIAKLQERMESAEEKLKGGGYEPLFSKLGLIGDSLTNQTTQGWQELAVSMLGNPEWHKNAVTGSSVADYGDDRSENPSFVPFIDRYLNTPADCDCIVIMGGSNDATYQYNYELGTVGVLANNNYIGAYCTIIEGLFERNPATRIMLMTPPRLYTADRVLSTHIQKYVEATKEIAKYYGLPCLDLYDKLGWNDKTAAWCSANFAGDDPVHFSKAIGPRVGRMVANFIRLNY